MHSLHQDVLYLQGVRHAEQSCRAYAKRSAFGVSCKRDAVAVRIGVVIDRLTEKRNLFRARIDELHVKVKFAALHESESDPFATSTVQEFRNGFR